MGRSRYIASTAALLACLASDALAQAVHWADDFDSYPLGAVLTNPAENTGWEEFFLNPPGPTEVQNVAAGAAVRSAPHSIWLRGAGDAVHRFDGNGPHGEGPYTSGRWTLASWVYKPATTTGFTMTVDQYWIVLNTYVPGCPCNWSVLVQMDPVTGLWVADTATTSYSGAAAFDRWVELRAEIDLDADSVELFYDGTPMGAAYPWNGGVSGFGTGATAIGALDLFANGFVDPSSRIYYDDLSLRSESPINYCTAGTSASGCQATLSSTGTPSASAGSGFVVTATGVEGSKDGQFFYGANGRQANPWGVGSSYQCVVPPVRRGGLQIGTGAGCGGSASQDINARWAAVPSHNPGAGAIVQLQYWYRDPQNPSGQTTSMSDALEFCVQP